jgi:sigma-B regulation protein RsbU (phosphoserine phosphatase)
MWTTHVAGLVRAHAARTAVPEEIIHRVNSDLCLMSTLRPFASLFLAKLDPITGLLNYCSAGHPPAFVLRANGTLESLSEGGLLLGVLPDAVYVHGTIRLDFGDTLLTYSDGIIESLDKTGEEFGYTRLEKQLRRAPTDTADSILFSLLGAVQDFAGTRPLVDDMTVAVVRRAKLEAAAA